MPTALRTTVAAAALFAGLLAPAAVASADALPLTPMGQSVEPVAGPSTTGTGSINTGPNGTGSFDPSAAGSSNLIKALATGSGQCNTPVFPVYDGSANPLCSLYH